MHDSRNFSAPEYQNNKIETLLNKSGLLTKVDIRKSDAVKENICILTPGQYIIIRRGYSKGVVMGVCAL